MRNKNKWKLDNEDRCIIPFIWLFLEWNAWISKGWEELSAFVWPFFLYPVYIDNWLFMYWIKIYFNIILWQIDWGRVCRGGDGFAWLHSLAVHSPGLLCRQRYDKSRQQRVLHPKLSGQGAVQHEHLSNKWVGWSKEGYKRGEKSWNPPTHLPWKKYFSYFKKYTQGLLLLLMTTIG